MTSAPLSRHDARDSDSRATPIVERLTPREIDVLALMATGVTNRAIAGEMGIEFSTVQACVRSLLNKLGMRSRVEAMALAYRHGLVRETGDVR